MFVHGRSPFVAYVGVAALAVIAALQVPLMAGPSSVPSFGSFQTSLQGGFLGSTSSQPQTLKEEVQFCYPMGLDASQCDSCELNEEWSLYYGEPIWTCVHS